jgi:hypothetical protein
VSLFKAASTVSLLTLVSRVTGLVRDLLMASAFGVSGLTDAFNVAFRIPNLLRRLFAEGAFSQAFVPVLAASKARDGEAATRVLIDDVATVLTWVLLADLRGRRGRRAAAGADAGQRAGPFQLGGRRADDALDVPLHRLHVAGGAVGRHSEHLEALCRAGGHAGAAEPGDDRRRLVGRPLVRHAWGSSPSMPWPPA